VLKPARTARSCGFRCRAHRAWRQRLHLRARLDHYNTSIIGVFRARANALATRDAVIGRWTSS